MHIHILGICGTFMGGLACIGVEKGFKVTGSDENVYPPMSAQLERLGIKLHKGYDPKPLIDNPPDVVIIGNALKRGVPVVEYVLNEGLKYCSGPKWLAENVLGGNGFIAAFIAGAVVRHGYEDAGEEMIGINEAWGHLLVYLVFYLYFQSK